MPLDAVEKFVPSPELKKHLEGLRESLTGARRPAPRVLDLIAGEPWLITAEALAQIVAIAERVNDSPEAVATRLGRPLDNTRTVQLHGSTAVIPVHGPILRYANLFTEISGATSLEVLARDFQAASDNPQVRQIVLDIDSPGGQSKGIAEFGGIIAEAPKPVTAFVGDTAASAAYWLASQAREIVISPTSMLGSIGVVLSHRPVKDGPLEIVSSASPLKRATPDTPEGRAEWQRLVDQIAAVFVAAVARGRGVPEAKVLSDFGRGALLVGEHAVAAGMADRIAPLSALLSPSAGIAPGSTSRRTPIMAASDPGAPTIDRAFLNTYHPDLVAAIRAEGHADGLTAGRLEGAVAERERIQSVRAQSIPGHEALIEALAFDGKTTGPEAAVQILAAERTLRERHQDAIAKAPPPVASADRADPDEAAAAKRAKAAAVAAAQAKLMSQVAGGN